jgi:hypothetical protein
MKYEIDVFSTVAKLYDKVLWPYLTLAAMLIFLIDYPCDDIFNRHVI